MFVSMRICALRDFLATSVRRRTIAAGCCLVVLLAITQSVNSQVIQDYHQSPFASSTGVFEWDNFTTTFGPTPDAQATGIGSASLMLDSVAQPFDGPPVAIVTSTSNIYTGGTLTEFSVQLSEMDAAETYTTIVLQVSESQESAVGSFAGFELNGQVPTKILDRGVVEDVLHGSGATPLDTNFYWVQWQLENVTDVEITFSNTVTHQSLAGIRVDYFNSSSPTDVIAPEVLTAPVVLGDVNLDAEVNFLDISPFIAILSTADFLAQADMDGNGEVNFLDIAPFISALSGS